MVTSSCLSQQSALTDSSISSETLDSQFLHSSIRAQAFSLSAWLLRLLAINLNLAGCILSPLFNRHERANKILDYLLVSRLIQEPLRSTNRTDLREVGPFIRCNCQGGLAFR